MLAMRSIYIDIYSCIAWKLKTAGGRQSETITQPQTQTVDFSLYNCGICGLRSGIYGPRSLAQYPLPTHGNRGVLCPFVLDSINHAPPDIAYQCRPSLLLIAVQRYGDTHSSNKVRILIPSFIAVAVAGINMC